MKALAEIVFKGRFGISQAGLNQLVREGKVRLQQNGYLGDSTHHHKLVIFPDDFQLTPELPRLKVRKTHPFLRFPDSYGRQPTSIQRWMLRRWWPHGERKT